jgi:hypothetical protein
LPVKPGLVITDLIRDAKILDSLFQGNDRKATTQNTRGISKTGSKKFAIFHWNRIT